MAAQETSIPVRGIAIVVHNLDVAGGMERQAARLAEQLAARGLEITIITTRSEPRLTFPPRVMRRWHECRGLVSIVRVPAFENWTPRAIHLLVDVVSIWVLMRRRKRIDAIHAIQYTGGRHAALAAEVTGLPATVKFACSGEHGDFQVLARHDEAEQIRHALGVMSRYVIISEEIRREAREAGLDPSRFVRIRNGVDTQRFSTHGSVAELPELAAPEGRKIVLFAGRHDTQKRVDVLLRAFAKVLEAVPEARLASAGSGPRLDDYRALARELGIADKVAFLGTRSDMDALYRAAKVFVLPSASEGLPNALLEALACGTPCVATAIPGTTDVVRHEQEALLVPRDDVGSLAAAIVRVLQDRVLAERLAQAGRARIQAEFDMSSVADQHVTLFSEVARTATPVSGLLAQGRFASVLGGRIMALLLAAGPLELRDAITRRVVSMKRLLGIEGALMARLHG
jgi:glycosyltransferase involved in cell wall biosynthesis